MSNNKQQTAVEMMWNEIDNLFPFKDSVEAQKFCAILDKYKEMEKEQAIKFACDVHMNVKKDKVKSLMQLVDEHYKQTYGGGEQ